MININDMSIEKIEIYSRLKERDVLFGLGKKEMRVINKGGER